jgi:ankyrin repeat protein
MDAAIERNNLAKVKELLDSGTDINIRIRGNLTPLGRASELGFKEIANLLIERGANVNEVYSPEYKRETPLILAAAKTWRAEGSDYLGLITLLLDKGANINHRTGRGETPLSVALDRQFYQGVHLLLDRGAEVRRDALWTFALSFDSPEKLALAKKLIEKGADVNARNAHRQPLITFVTVNLDMVKLLVESGADIDAKDPTTGYTALYTAVRNRDRRMVEYLLSKGADVNATHNHGDTALMLAARTQQENMVRMLLADPKIDTWIKLNGRTTALEEQSTPRIRQLIQAHRAKMVGEVVVKKDLPANFGRVIGEYLTGPVRRPRRGGKTLRKKQARRTRRLR